jgi:hypothetical protein
MFAEIAYHEKTYFPMELISNSTLMGWRMPAFYIREVAQW